MRAASSTRSWNQRTFAAAAGSTGFAQDNHSRSAAGVLGAIFDVAADIRRASPTFGQ